MFFRKLAILSLLSVFVVSFSACTNEGKTELKDEGNDQANIKKPKESTKPTNSTKSPEDDSLQSVYGFDKQAAPPEKGEVFATLDTSEGVIKMKFFQKQAPKAVENFITHSKNGYYNGIKFHRVIEDFMIQGGDPKGDGTGGESIWKKQFEDEFSKQLHHIRGAVSMANSGPNTNGSQFFIVNNKTIDENTKSLLLASGFFEPYVNSYVKYGGTPHLDGGHDNWNDFLAKLYGQKGSHTVFAQVYEGMEVVDKIAEAEKVGNPMQGVPKKPVVIKSIVIDTVK